MGSPTNILCPGQGAQTVGMGKSLYDASSRAKSTLDQADAVLGFSLTSLCFTGPEERLNQTDISQPAIYATSIASYRAAIEAGVVDPSTVVAFAGLSLGEYTALHLAGVFTFEDGLKLVAARGRYMQEAAVASPSGMVAMIGADEAKVRELCEANAQGEVLVPANFNTPGQIVVSGTKSACERVQKAAEAAGLKASILKVAGAFHSPLMQPAADRMLEELNNVTFSAPTAPVYSNVTAKPHTDADSIRKLLVEQIVSPVQWEQTQKTLLANDTQRFIELAPGRTLTGLAKRINRRLPIHSIDNAAALAEAKETLAAVSS